MMPTGSARQEHDSVTEPNRLANVVRDEEHRETLLPPDALDLVVEDIARHRVERSERLVHQQDVDVLRERTRERDPLPHPTGKLVRSLGRELAEVHDLEQVVAARTAFLASDTIEPERQLDVASGGEPREQRGFLEHEPCAAVDV